MKIVVQKFGGTSVDGPERIRNVARWIIERKKRATAYVPWFLPLET